MRGYKGFDKDLKCRGFQFEVGQTFEISEDPVICQKGFHFCEKLNDVNEYYRMSASRVCEVEALGSIVKDGNKCATNKIKVVRELTREELESLTDNFKFNTGNQNTGNQNTGNQNTGHFNAGYCNSGNKNTGNKNTGNQNTGHFNAGYCNSGNKNTGNQNTGNQNTGHFNAGYCNSGNNNAGNQNTGHFNAGYRNTGDFNTGNQNTGHFNTGHYNTGHFNTGSWDDFRLFDRKAKRSEWEDANKPNFIYDLEPNKTDGDMKKAWKLAFDSATEEDIKKLLALPKFSKKVFKEITGIDLRSSRKRKQSH